MKKESQMPFFAKAAIFFVGISALLTMLYIARSIIVPVVFSGIVAIVLYPVVNLLVRIRVNRFVAILITLFLAFVILAAFGVLLFFQVRRLSESWPLLVERFTGVLDQAIAWVSGRIGMNPQSIHDWIDKTEAELINSSSDTLGQTIVTVSNGVVILLLIPVYIFMIMFYQPIIREFIHRLFSTRNRSQVTEIVTQTKTVIQNYLVGLVIEAVIVAALNTGALLILGIDFAILLGIIGALLNVIPYIGGVIAVALPMMVALATKSSGWYALYVMGAYLVIQLVDNNLIIPKIVAGKVKINALFSIIVVIAGNALWGIPGMFVSIPLLAIVKLIFDHIEPLKPWGYLLGDTMPPLLAIAPILKKIRSKSKLLSRSGKSKE